MEKSFFTSFLSSLTLILLPIFATQLRYFIYRKDIKDENGKGIYSKVLEFLPHDLFILSFALGFIAAVLIINADFETLGNIKFYLLFPLYVPITLLASSFFLKPSLRLYLGITVYLIEVIFFLSLVTNLMISKPM